MHCDVRTGIYDDGRKWRCRNAWGCGYIQYILTPPGLPPRKKFRLCFDETIYSLGIFFVLSKKQRGPPPNQWNFNGLPAYIFLYIAYPFSHLYYVRRVSRLKCFRIYCGYIGVGTLYIYVYTNIYIYIYGTRISKLCIYKSIIIYIYFVPIYIIVILCTAEATGNPYIQIQTGSI